jgi:hypothetical protein
MFERIKEIAKNVAILVPAFPVFLGGKPTVQIIRFNSG